MGMGSSTHRHSIFFRELPSVDAIKTIVLGALEGRSIDALTEEQKLGHWDASIVRESLLRFDWRSLSSELVATTIWTGLDEARRMPNMLVRRDPLFHLRAYAVSDIPGSEFKKEVSIA